MMELVMSPIFWIGIALVLVAIIILSALISSKRSKEVDELGTYFPDGEVDHSSIPVEKVRRSTLARQQRKQQSQHVPRRQPREDVLALEKQEFVTTERIGRDATFESQQNEEENDELKLPTTKADNLTERQASRQQVKSNILQSRSTALSTSTNSKRNQSSSYSRRTSLGTENGTSTETNSRPPLRRTPTTGRAAYPSLRKGTDTTESTSENTTSRLPNRRTKRMF
jgi:hypothetical protein